ncbi:MAG: HAMP domain-containing histidine kinase [Lachnospiraceae bacterium]|nr:HAMP domain-containing histidine kinase [Lachnospiraceae bacterium]
MEIRRNLTGMHKTFYYAMAIILIAGLMLMVNVIILLTIAIQYHRDMPEYVQGGEVMEELTLTEEGYELSDAVQVKMEELDQWAILLNEDGKVIWSYRKPVEIKESYSQSDIARMSRYYLKDYPVYLRVWDDRIMVVGLPKYSMWKYNMEFPIPWMEYVKEVWFWIVLFDFLLILVLSFFFTRRWSKNREQVRIEWIAGISHDIRTPLSMVMGYSDTLQNSENLSAEEQRQMAVIRHQSIVMKELVEDLNLTSRLEYSMQALRMEKVRPAVVLREVAAAFLSDAKEGELEIDVDISGQSEEIWIKADRNLLVRALRNLFHNSLQHSEQRETMVITLRMWKEGRWCFISFSDNGVGYSPEVLHQMHNQKKKRVMQNIRGLGIVQKVVMAHGGKIHFENNGQGGGFCEMKFRAYTAKSR